MNSQMIKLIEEILTTKTVLKRVESGLYAGKIHVDFRERLEDRVLRQVFSNSAPKKVLESMLASWYANCEKSFKNDILSIIENHLHEVGRALEYHEHEGSISDWLDAHIKFEYPNGQFLDQRIATDIFVTPDTCIAADLISNNLNCHAGSFIILLVKLPVIECFELIDFVKESKAADHRDRYFTVRKGANCILDTDSTTIVSLGKDYKLCSRHIDKIVLDCCAFPESLKDTYKLQADLWGDGIFVPINKVRGIGNL